MAPIGAAPFSLACTLNLDAATLVTANGTGPTLFFTWPRLWMHFSSVKKQPMNVWRDERARDIFVGGTTPMEWSTMPLEASSVRHLRHLPRPSLFHLTAWARSDKFGRYGYGSCDRPRCKVLKCKSAYGGCDQTTYLPDKCSVSYSLHIASSICLTFEKRPKIRDVTANMDRTTLLRKDKCTPPWDLKKEREHEAANPGPSISMALMQGRSVTWQDPSSKKALRPDD